MQKSINHSASKTAAVKTSEEKDAISDAVDRKPKDNPLIFREKPYYTDEEQRLYYKIAIDEFTKQDFPEMAAHYQILLNMLERKKSKILW